MRKLIFSNSDNCVGCNRCTRSCPIETANITKMGKNEEIKVEIDPNKCIACGVCISVCKHNARGYEDDTERFIHDLQNGVEISLIVAPAFRSNIKNAENLFSWFRKLGVRKIYDVSLGEDICTWAHIRYIQKKNPVSVITQPCPVIVNYCLMYQPKLLQYLSPVHSPMLCTAIYMKQHERVNSRIAAISPCIAKSHEFESTGLVQYNVTIKKLTEYIQKHNIRLPNTISGFDHYQSGLGSVYSMPGGLKENVEYFLDKSLRIDKSEGQETVYNTLNDFLKQPSANLPDIFDVLNCTEGCNAGTGCVHNKNIFEINTSMESARKDALKNRSRAYFDKLYKTYDKNFQLEDFIRKYRPISVHISEFSENDIENAFRALGKNTKIAREFDCGACGSNTCLEMARKIAIGVNIHQNCIQKARENMREDNAKLIDIQRSNVKNAVQILNDINNIKSYTDKIAENIKSIDNSIDEYSKMAKIINSISAQINIISLNASIEAVKAGEYGKAFSVVTSEIINLAEVSKAAVSKSENISFIAGHSMGEVNEIITQILSAVKTAQNDIEEINKSQLNEFSSIQ